jgi:hypothetical protein
MSLTSYRAALSRDRLVPNVGACDDHANLIGLMLLLAQWRDCEDDEGHHPDCRL